MDRHEDQLVRGAEFALGQTIRFRYRNWQGSVAVRTAQVIRLSFGSIEWHPEPHWLLEALDVEKNALRLFALRDMIPIDLGCFLHRLSLRWLYPARLRT